MPHPLIDRAHHRLRMFGVLEALGYRGQVLQGDDWAHVDAAGYLELQRNAAGRVINNVLFKWGSPHNALPMR